MNARMRVLLVEDHPVVLHGLRAICTSNPTIDVVGEAATAAEAVQGARELQPDVAVVPVRLGGTRGGIELCRSIKSVCGARVVVFTSFTRTVDVQVAMLAGADALISKTATSDVFIAALQQVKAGRQALFVGTGPTPLAAAASFDAMEPLTEREEEILGLVVDGLTNPEIAARLTIEVSTVKTHMRSVLRKLRVDTRRDLLVELAQ
ncbi:two component transcriptional regulator, LuxR family [Promicromonospora umidemergens]|nr:two component transcriptional regulator, LuxR family [Promicromonospora umidemergens]